MKKESFKITLETRQIVKINGDVIGAEIAGNKFKIILTCR